MDNYWEVLLYPGIIIGELVFLSYCHLGIGSQKYCFYSGTSPLERNLIDTGNVIFYAAVIFFIVKRFRKKK